MPDLSSVPPPDRTTRRGIDLARTGPGSFRVTNERGGSIELGPDDTDFTPVELFLASLAACAAVNVEEITGRRAAPERFDVRAEGEKVRDESGGRMTSLRLLFDVAFPDGPDGDAARAVLPRTLQQTHDRICTVSRTVTTGEPVDYLLAEQSGHEVHP